MEFAIGLLVISLLVVFIYNGLINKKNQVENAFAGMDVQLKKRYDLIPNLVAAVKEYMKHEADTLNNITMLRTKALESNSLSNNEKIQLDNQISKGLGGLMVQVENYPELKANTNFINLQSSLNEVEAQISASRRAYNAAVTDFNNAIEMIPGSLFAGPMKLSKRELFVIPDAQKENVNVASLFNN